MKRKKRIYEKICILLSCLLVAAFCAGCGGPGEENMKISRIDLNQAHLTQGIWREKYEQNDAYIRHLDAERLLYYYYYYAGLPIREGLTPYPDWESGDLHKGITMGHYVSALSMLYRVTGEAWYAEKVAYCVDELAKCQREDGLLFAQPAERFDLLEDGADIFRVGPPYYYIHKLLAGLIDAYRYCGSEKALETALKLSDWIYDRMSGLSRLKLENVLRTEYGGICEALYQLYDLTENGHALLAARLFHEELYLNLWAKNEDNLYMLHANTTIPKAIGFAVAYRIEGEERYLQAAENFWEMVVSHRTYANGGNSRGEAFWEPDKIYEYCDEEEDHPSETCNIYNMLKLSQYLYEYTRNPKYLDYMETALCNGILGSLNEQGCKTYYQFLHRNAHKVFHALDGGFWCCTGTGMENFAKVLSQCFYEREGGLDVLQFLSCELTTKEGIRLSISAGDECATLRFLSGGKLDLRLRVPAWCEESTLEKNGQVLSATAKDGFVRVSATFAEGDEVRYRMKYPVRWERTAADEPYYAIKYGPYLMCAIGSDAILTRAEFDSLGDLDFEGAQASVRLGEKTFRLKKYAEIVDETFTTYFEVV